MIICPNCEHHNPEGAIQCEACFTSLPQQANCRNCGAVLLSNATFCGQCGVQSPFDGSWDETEVTASQPLTTPPNLVETQKNSPIQGPRQIPTLFHQQTQTILQLPQGLEIIHIGKPNEHLSPDIDVSGFPHSDIVSRLHADIRVEGNIFYIEDVGSSNGTYINHTVLPPGYRHRLRDGDRISLGKEDLVTLIFQLS
ncbi:MAG: FHA domain-containing protein [Cyanobacteria bacterium P01_G01_bin.49]